MGAYPAANCTCCASRCGGQPQVVSINDDVRPAVQGMAFGNQDIPDKWEDEIPDWLAALAPGLAAEEAAHAAREWAQCAKDLRQRARAFVHIARAGVPCRLLDQVACQARPATYKLDNAAEVLSIQEDVMTVQSSQRGVVTCLIAELRNIWVCTDSPLARRAHASLGGSAADVDLACMVLLDAPAGPVGLILRSPEAREEFLDCMAVLISGERLRCEPSLARCDLPGGLPPPEAQLRHVGRSLQSVHLSGPICAWLAHVGEDLLTPDQDEKEFAAQVKQTFAGDGSPRRREDTAVAGTTAPL